MLDRLLFGLGVAAFVFLGGIYVGWYRLPPTGELQSAFEAARDWRVHWRSYLGLKPTKYVRPNAVAGPDLPPQVSAQAQPGVTLLTGMFEKEVGAVLVSLDGKVLHRWPIRFDQIWGDASHVEPEELPLNNWDSMIHGMVLYKNGDIVFNLSDLGLVRLDRCGDVLWRLPYRTHHSAVADDAGNLWVAGLKGTRTVADPRFPGLDPPYRDETILQVSPEDGQILREISLLEVIYRSRYEGVLFPNGLDLPNPPGWDAPDPLHLNHVEVLSAELAPAFPLFKAGDILVSLRNLNLVMVIDGRTLEIKWSQTGPWVRQHEPHFLPNGQISVFDNRRLPNAQPWAKDRPRFASRILSIDPRTDRVTVLFEGSKTLPFYTEQLGKEQFLANGNILLTEARAGRALEVTPAGEAAWWFVNRYDAKGIAKISQATRYPEDYGNFVSMGCPAAVAGVADAHLAPAP